MPPKRKYNSVKSGGKREKMTLRKRNVTEACVSTSVEKNSMKDQTPKKSTRSKTVSRSDSEPQNALLQRKSRSGRKDSKEEVTCAFYKTTESEDGKPIFNKDLLKYFLKADSPEVNDLKNKRFNTSFLHTPPRPRDHVIQVFTPEEDRDPKWIENVPNVKFDMPEVPGSEYVDIFKSMPIDDFDEELKTFMNKTPKGKSTRATAFKGKPLPEQSLTIDYTGLLDSESSCDDLVKGNEMRGNVQLSQCNDLCHKKEDEMLLNKYKDIMGNRHVNVVLTRLSVGAQLEICNKRKRKAKGCH